MRLNVKYARISAFFIKKNSNLLNSLLIAIVLNFLAISFKNNL